MNLHFRGIQVPALGSLRDIMYRRYLTYEAKTEAKKQQLNLLHAIGGIIIDPDKRSRWERQVKTTYEEYVSLLFGVEIQNINSEEETLKNFYKRVIKPSNPKLKRGNNRKLVVENLPEF